jgi:DNA (cytosine-5)-methyltransferase 1
MGLHRAGFDVIGIDEKPQPNYPFRFIQGDALQPPVPLQYFDFVWASPPCQAFTAYRRRPDHVAECADMIGPVRELLTHQAACWCIENVPAAPLRGPMILCGSMFGLEVRRHRAFETSFPMLCPPCDHSTAQGSWPQATNRTKRRRTCEVGVWRIPLTEQHRAMGIDWMTLEELSEAIPPAYSEFIGRCARAQT